MALAALSFPKGPPTAELLGFRGRSSQQLLWLDSRPQSHRLWPSGADLLPSASVEPADSLLLSWCLCCSHCSLCWMSPLPPIISHWPSWVRCHMRGRPFTSSCQDPPPQDCQGECMPSKEALRSLYPASEGSLVFGSAQMQHTCMAYLPSVTRGWAWCVPGRGWVPSVPFSPTYVTSQPPVQGRSVCWATVIPWSELRVARA